MAEAVARADRIRDESERELAAHIQRRNAINAQLTNVRQMLATLGGATIVNPLADLDEPADDDVVTELPAEAEDAIEEAAETVDEAIEELTEAAPEATDEGVEAAGDAEASAPVEEQSEQPV